MPRLFAALRPPPEIREALRARMGGVEGARWQTDNQLHLTLAFIGEVDRHGLEAATEALADIHRPPLDLRLAQPGSFDSHKPGRTSALWVGVSPADAIADLAAQIRNSLRRAGLETESRRFVPHITLARFSAAGAPREALRPWLNSTHIPPLHWRVESFHLVESHMGNGGSHYTPIASYHLT